MELFSFFNNQNTRLTQKLYKKMKTSIKLLLVVAVGLLFSQASKAQTAELQVIHNCPDPAADSVDVYVNGMLTLDNFAFRTATSFLSLPAGVDINIGIAPKSSASFSDTLVSYTVNLVDGQKYVAIASGVLNPAGFASNPDAINTGFTLLLKDNIRTAAGSGTDVDFIVLHGATDAPTVDVIPQSSATPLVNDAAYSDITSYLSVPAASYILNVTPGNDNSTVVASYVADLSALGGGAAVVFASGFLDPLMNQNGPAFGLYAALPNGAVVAFPAATTARLQVIHNAADPAAAVVDIYLNGTLLLPDFAFRTATSFIDAPAGTLLNIGVAPGNSTSVGDTLKNFEVTLQAGQSYVAVANGNVGTGFASNPDGRSTAFTLFVKNTVRESGTSGSNVDFFALHGATDAPTVDVIPQSSVAPLVNDAAYGDITSYLSVPAASYILNVTPGNDNSTVVASYLADLSTLGGGAAVVFASGYLDPLANNNGPAFGLYAALPNGAVVAFPAATTARLQVIHNAADPAAALVDIYVNGNLLIPDLAFRAATSFIDAPAGTLLNIGVAPGNSTSVLDTLKNFEVTLQAGQSYVAIANGVIGTGFAANPDGRSTAFSLFVKSGVREAAADNSTVDFFAVHGATDAPTVDVIARGVATLVDDAAYGDLTGYISVPPSVYTLDVTPGANNSVIVATFSANLSTLGGGAAVVFASGFLDPSMNNNGEAFGLFAALPNGTVVPFSNTTGIEETIDFSGGLFPNPVADVLNISMRSNTTDAVIVTITDVTGRIVVQRSKTFAAGEILRMDVNDLKEGVYSCTLSSGSSKVSKSFLVIR